jgi:hypothetical protein
LLRHVGGSSEELTVASDVVVVVVVAGLVTICRLYGSIFDRARLELEFT